VPSPETICCALPSAPPEPPDEPDEEEPAEPAELYADDTTVEKAVPYEEAVLDAHDDTHEDAVLNSVWPAAMIAYPMTAANVTVCRMIVTR